MKNSRKSDFKAPRTSHPTRMGRSEQLIGKREFWVPPRVTIHTVPRNPNNCNKCATRDTRVVSHVDKEPAREGGERSNHLNWMDFVFGGIIAATAFKILSN
jgi:hypothetical protein